MALQGIICQTCHNTVVDSEHQKIHDMNEGEIIVWEGHSDEPAARITKVRESSYIAEVIANGKKIEIHEDQLDQFRLPFEEEEWERPSTENY